MAMWVTTSASVLDTNLPPVLLPGMYIPETYVASKVSVLGSKLDLRDTRLQGPAIKQQQQPSDISGIWILALRVLGCYL